MNKRTMQCTLAVLSLLTLIVHATATELRIPSRPSEVLQLAARQDAATSDVIIDILLPTPNPAITSVRLFENGNLVLETREPFPLKIRRDMPLAGTYVYRAEAIATNDVIGVSNLARLTIAAAAVATPIGEDNGIAVGAAKAFDDRALVDMLNDTVASLQQTQSSFIDPTKLVAGIGSFQGGESTKTGVGVSISTLPAPSLERQTVRTLTKKAPTSNTTTTTGTDGDSSNTTSTGAVDESTETTTDGSTRGQVEPESVQTTDTSSTAQAFTFTPTFGLAPADLLAQQTELAYEAANLRLLLQRAVSDRALIETTEFDTKIDQRMQVVLGFQVSVEPLARYRGGVAEAIITITPKDTRNRLADAPSLVALLPREKSYNVATVRKSSQAFSLGGIVQALNVGAAVNRSRDTLYLVKDTDTVALERVPAKSNAIEFAWQFRPVLDQKTVTPGTRQMFAVISLPAGAKEDWIGEVSVQTRWRRYNRRKKAVAESYEDSTRQQPVYDLRLDSLAKQARAVAPKIDDIAWDEAGNGQVFVTVQGRFPVNTNVAAGDLVRSPGSGLIVDTNRRLTFTLPALKLFLGDVTLVDRYGEVQAAVYRAAKDEKNKDGFGEIEVKATRVGVNNTELTIFISPDLDLREHRPLFRIGNAVFGLSDNPVSLKTDVFERNDPVTGTRLETKRRLVAEIRAPRQLVADARTVQVIDPFWGNKFNRTVPVYWVNGDATVASGVQVVSAGDGSVTLSVSGDQLDRELKVYVGNTPIEDSQISVRTPSLLMLTVARAALAGAKHLVIEPKDRQSPPIVLSLPTADLSQPQVLRHADVLEGDTGRIRLDGADLQDVDKIYFNNEEVPFKDDKVRPGRAIYLDPEDSFAATPGNKELSIVAKDGTVQTFTITVKPQPAEKQESND